MRRQVFTILWVETAPNKGLANVSKDMGLPLPAIQIDRVCDDHDPETSLPAVVAPVLEAAQSRSHSTHRIGVLSLL